MDIQEVFLVGGGGYWLDVSSLEQDSWRDVVKCEFLSIWKPVSF
jgi:hypothetical protein